MCLGVPGRIVTVWEEGGTVLARADFAGEERRICLAYLPDLAAGDYVVVHAGFALTKISEESAQTTLAMMHEYGVLPGAPPQGSPA